MRFVGVITGAFVVSRPAFVLAQDIQAGAYLQQCTKWEEGCTNAQNYEVLTAPFAGIDHPYRFHTSIKLFKEHTATEGCQKPFGDEVKILKGRCETFDISPRADTTLNYVLPDSKVANHCDIVGFDGKDCRGKEIFYIEGQTSLHTINGQSFCHKAPWIKSIIVKNCS